MILTATQQSCLETFSRFIDSTDHVFILKGAAGTGKTTLVKEFVQLLNERKRRFSLMAPTGRAALILDNKTQYDSRTIHRSIYQMDRSPIKIDEQWIFTIKENEDDTNHIYFIDEASMVADVFTDNEMMRFGSGRVMSDLVDYCNPTKTNRKIVFIGDYAQLPPVNQAFSPALSAEYISSTFGLKVQETKLTEVVRQNADSGILANADTIRKAIDSGTYNKFQIADGADVKRLDTTNLEKEYQQILEQESNPNAIIICHSNRQALDYNIRIRDLLWGDGYKPIQPDDIIINTRNNYSKNIELYNGMTFRVLDVSPNVEVHTPYVGDTTKTLRFRRIILDTGAEPTSIYMLEDFLTDKNGSLTIDMSKALWADFEQRMRDEGIRPNDKLYGELLRKDPYYNALQCKYGYAITCHKAQGGEWDNVIVNMDTFMGKHNEMFFRWAYTALTRSRNNLWHISTPSFSAIDQMVIQEILPCSATIVNHNIPHDSDWKNSRFKSVNTIASLMGIECSENQSVAYQHRITFKQDNNICELALWYNKKFYTGKMQVIKGTSEPFNDICKSICQESLYINKYEFTPRFPFQQELHNHLIDIANEVGVNITNVTQRQWSDVYSLKTDAHTAYIEFFFNGKHFYTYAQPYSSNGANDELLQKFISTI